MKKAFTFFLAAFAVWLHAQTPHVVAVSPAGGSLSAQPAATLTIDFDTALDPATVGTASVSIFGRWSGPAAGTFALENGDTRIVFTPAEPFFAGEAVSVSVNKLLHAASGEALPTGYAWAFNIRTLPGTLSQTLIDEIDLRLPGEGLIQTYGAYAGDLNNDGYSDLTAVNENSDDLRILLNDGTGAYPGPFELLDTGSEKPSPSEGGDFNSDGEIDLVVTTAHGGETRILFGDGQGSFAEPVVYSTGQATRGVGVLDLEGDGDDDIVVVNRDDDNLNLLWNDGTGVFSVTEFDSPGDGETGLAIADANGDGLPDLFVGYYDSKKIAVLLGDGAGNFTVSGSRTVTGQPWMIGAGDLDGDGDADVVSANSTGHNVSVLFGDGLGGLSAPVNYPNVGQFPLAIDLGDLDGDGDLDITTSQYGSGNFAVFGNNGSGVFAAPIYLPSAQNASCTILHDRDNDGDLDITGTDEGDDVIRLFENPGISPVTEVAGIALSWQVAPNPFTATATVFYAPDGDVQPVFEVTDLAGRLVGIYPGGPSGKIDLAASNWPPGVYRVGVQGKSGGVKLVKTTH